MIRIQYRSVWAFVLCMVFTAVLPARLEAELIMFGFRGTVDQVSVRPRYGMPTVDWPPVGSTFEGTYTFESTTPDTGAEQYQGIYRTQQPGGQVYVAMDEFRWTALSSTVVTFDSDGIGPDIYEAGSSNIKLISHPELDESLDRWNFRLSLRGGNSLLESVDLLLVPPFLDRADVKTLTLLGDNSLNTSPFPLLMITASLEVLSVVPEPNSVGLLCAAAAPLLLTRCWRRRSK